MTIDLAALEDPTLAGYVQSIPLNVDPFPYADLQAQGRYPIQSTPDTIPQMLAYLAGVDAENGQGGRVGYIDSQHRLLVHDPSSGGGITRMQLDISTFESGLDLAGGSHREFVTCNTFPAFLYAVNATAYFDTGQTPANGYLTMGLASVLHSGPDIVFGNCALASTGMCTPFSAVYPTGFELDAGRFDFGNLLAVYFETNTPPVTVTFSLILGTS